MSMDKRLHLLKILPQGHKFALKDIKKDQPIIKYGYPIGIAKEDIKQGSWIHTHNMKTGLNDLLTYSYHRNVQELEPSENEHSWVIAERTVKLVFVMKFGSSLPLAP